VTDSHRLLQNVSLLAKSHYVLSVFFNAVGATDEGRRADRLPGQTKLNRAPLILYFGFSLFLVFSRFLFFFAVFATFSGDVGF